MSEQASTSNPVEGAGDPMETEEHEEEVADQEGTENEATPGGDEREGGIDLKKMADDYAKYLIVNSKQDVR